MPVQNHPQRAQTVNLQTSRAPQVAAPAQPHTGLRRAAPPPRPPPPAHGVNPDISRPVHRTAGQLPPLNIGSVAGRIGGGGGGVGPLLAKTTAGHGVGEAFVSARGVKRVADVFVFLSLSAVSHCTMLMWAYISLFAVTSQRLPKLVTLAMASLACTAVLLTCTTAVNACHWGI